MPSVEEFKAYLASAPPKGASVRTWQKRVGALAVDKGFNTNPIDQKLLLAVGELIEAQNELRDGRQTTDLYESNNGLKPEGFGIELADAVIRIMHIAEDEGIDLEHCMTLKHEYNVTRPFRHNKAF